MHHFFLSISHKKCYPVSLRNPLPTGISTTLLAILQASGGCFIDFHELLPEMIDSVFSSRHAVSTVYNIHKLLYFQNEGNSTIGCNWNLSIYLLETFLQDLPHRFCILTKHSLNVTWWLVNCFQYFLHCYSLKLQSTIHII